ncbi:MAG: Hsp20/alpha crystallin family protein [Promethearchaeota archaeon]|nr:MAG: Hsp20/alpha crystallin family protein [Candidatus Lokiarchaeota archaeon]
MNDKDDEKYEEDPNDEDDDETPNPFNFFNLLQDPGKLGELFGSKQFQDMFQKVFKQIMGNLDKFPIDLKNLSPEEFQKELMKNMAKLGIKGPFMTGFNVSFDSEGNPVFDSFGNIKQKPDGKAEVDSVRQPLVEINEEEDHIIVIAEMPGVTKSDITLKATTHKLTISTEEKSSLGHRYYKEIDLPVAITSDYAKARYANGILEVKLKKESDEEQKDIHID